VISKAFSRELDEFLRFRHLSRNIYGFFLEWSRIEPLARRMPDALATLRSSVEEFFTRLEAVLKDR